MILNRRNFAQSMAATAAITAYPVAFTADTVKIGYVSPNSGALPSHF